MRTHRTCQRAQHWLVTVLTFLSLACATTPQGFSPAPVMIPYQVTRSVLVLGKRELSLHLPVGAVAPLPSVLVFHSAMGRTNSVLRWCDSLAANGFAAVALDFFDGRTAAAPQDGLALRDAANLNSEEIQSTIAQAYKQLGSDPRLLSERRYLLGWSFGASWATYATSFLPNINAVVAYYGQSFADNPVLSGGLNSRVLLIGGEHDIRPSPSRLRRTAANLSAQGKHVSTIIFPAGHGFAETAHPGHDARVADQAWLKTLTFLRGSGK